MTTTKKVYNRYISNINYKLKKYEDELIIKEDKIGKILKLSALQDIKLRPIINMISNMEITSVNDIIIHKDVKDKDLVLAYLKTLLRLTAEVKDLNNSADILRKLLFSSDTVRKCMLYINNNISKDIIRGTTFYFPRVGKIEVGRKKNYFGKKYNNRKPDWHKSLLRLEEIAKSANRKTKDIYERYSGGIINKQQFIKDMKPYVYSPETPDLPQYLMWVVDDYSVWWIWHKVDCNIVNYKLYSFIPTNHIHIINDDGKRSQISVSETMTIDEIINTDSLGNRDKINCIFRKDKTYFKEL